MLDNDYNNEQKKETSKNPACGSAVPIANKKTLDRQPSQNSSTRPSKSGDHANPANLSAFTRQVVHGMKPPSITSKVKLFPNVLPNGVLASNSSNTTKSSPIAPLVQNSSNDLKSLKTMIDKALKARLYFLQQTGPYQFLIGGDSPDHKYRVTVGSQKCSCGRENICVHILFVMLRVFQVQVTDPILVKRQLKNFEVESLFHNFNNRRKLKMKSKSKLTPPKKGQVLGKPASIESVDGGSGGLAQCASAVSVGVSDVKDSCLRVETVEEETCPICLLELVEGESLTECKNGCQNKYHQHCIAIWASECSRQKEAFVCPLCRAAWSKDDGIASATFATTQIAAEVTRAAEVVPCDLLSTQEPSFLDETMPDVRMLASEWMKTFDEKLVEKLISKNWTDREIGMRRFSEEVAGAMLIGAGGGDGNGRAVDSYGWTVAFESAVSVLSHVLLDPVYKVFVAVLRAFRHILFYTPCQSEEQQKYLRCALKSFVRSLFVKCSDSNRKTSQLAISTLEEFIKGQDGGLAVGKDLPITESLGLGSLDYILGLILSTDDLNSSGSADWQLICGKLFLLEKLIQMFPKEFLKLKSVTDPGILAGRAQQLNLESYLDFLLQYQAHPHIRISKTSRKILSAIAVTGTNDGGDVYQRILSHVSNSVLVDSATKELLLSKLLKIEEDLNSDVKGRGANDHSLLVESRRSSVPGIYLEKAGRSRSRPSSSRCQRGGGGGFTAGGDPSGVYHQAKTASIRRISSFKNFQRGSRHSRGSAERGRPPLLKKNLSVSNDSVFYKSGELILQLSQSSGSGGARRELFPDRSLGSESEDSPRVLLARWKSEQSFFHSKSLIKSLFLSCARKNKTKCRDAATSMSPPLTSGFVFPPSAVSEKERNDWRKSSRLMVKRPSGLKSLKSSEAGERRSFDNSSGYFSGITPLTAEGEKVSFTSEVANTPHSSPEHTLEGRYRCKEEVEKEEAEALARALDLSDMRQDALPFVPGLSRFDPRSMSQSLMEELKETKISWTSFSSPNKEASSPSSSASSPSASYEENVHWKRGEIIGSGAACTCYQARDMKTGTLMAVKLISFCRNTTEEQDNVKKQIVDEVHTMAQLNHPNIVRILGATLKDTHVFIFFEWMPGRSITSLLERYGPFSEEVVIRYTFQILKGLVYLHDNHILHRDLKGANLLIDSTGQRLRIGDFGTSAWLSATETLQGEFQGQLKGTVAFMAPEVVRGADYGRSCDIWSLGCCIIEMLTGTPPWINKQMSNHLALMYKIASSSKPPPIPENIRPALKDFLLRCLDINPPDRPSAKELLKLPLFGI